MAVRARPPFRADHVGSFLRPQSLLEMRGEFEKGAVSAGALRAYEDECIADLVRFEEELGLESITDGEFRRGRFHADFINALEGVEFRTGTSPGVPSIAFITDKIGRPEGGIEVDNFRYLNSLTDRVAKQTIPSPTMTHFRGGREAIDKTAYPDLAEFFADLARVYREEIRDLAESGCRYLQLDDTNLAYLCDPKMRQQVADRGEDLDRLIDDYAQLINESIRARPNDMVVCIHTCRGNKQSQWYAEGSYETVAEAMFNAIDVDGFFLEYDDERSGGFEPLRFVPEGRTIVLGLVSSKWPRLEKKRDIIARIEEASRYVPLDRLCLSPQCGFASVSEGNKIDVDVEKAKLGLVIEVAREVWG
jgi:5-methyltetrahydropteroyltriglutamate--homocysteine methyltransferase